MAVASNVSPNTDNLQLPTGIVKLKGPGDADYVDMGEVTALTLNITPTLKSFMSKRGAQRVEVFSMTESTEAEITLTANEVTSRNLNYHMLGVENAGPPIAIDIGANTENVVALRYIGTNDTGPRFQLDLDLVRLTPASPLDLLADDWQALEMAGKVNWNPTGGTLGTGAFGILLYNITVEVP